MLRSDNLFAGNGTDMMLLERQIEILTRQLQDQRYSHQPQQVDNKIIESYTMPQFLCSINDNSPEFGDCRTAGTEFVGDTMRISPSELAISNSLCMGHSFSLNSICKKAEEIAAAEDTGGGSNSTENTASMIGGPSLKKRKAEFDIAEYCKDKEIGEETEAAANNNMQTGSTDNSKVSDKPQYIHVRARRGQANDRHSLAERARREKINKKMKYLQDLVPGCSKIAGKAGMLDEIISYVQSLQRQVEFLSMKLVSLNPTLDFNVNSFFMKEQAQALSTWETDLHTLGNAEFQ